MDDQKKYRDALAQYLLSEKDASQAPSQMDEFYNALRPHQRGLFNTIGAAAQGARGIYDSGVNALTTMHRILGNGDPVTMDEVASGARDAAGFALPGQVGLRRDPMRARDEAMALRMESQPGVSAMPGSRQVPSESIFAWGGEYPRMGGMGNFNDAANTATRMSPAEMRRLMRVVE